MRVNIRKYVNEDVRIKGDDYDEVELRFRQKAGNDQASTAGLTAGLSYVVAAQTRLCDARCISADLTRNKSACMGVLQLRPASCAFKIYDLAFIIN